MKLRGLYSIKAEIIGDLILFQFGNIISKYRNKNVGYISTMKTRMLTNIFVLCLSWAES